VERLRAAGTTLGLSIGANNNKLIISPIHPLVPCSLRHSSIRSPLPPARAPYRTSTRTCTSISWHKTTGKRKYVLVLAQTLRTAHTRSRRESCAIQQASSLSILPQFFVWQETTETGNFDELLPLPFGQASLGIMRRASSLNSIG